MKSLSQIQFEFRFCATFIYRPENEVVLSSVFGCAADQLLFCWFITEKGLRIKFEKGELN